ncbi:MAG TPA: transcriptional repressor [Mycobacteriales bacterium]|nr:transcriptional repressor [Mycobacteriales bacterium]
MPRSDVLRADAAVAAPPSAAVLHAEGLLRSQSQRVTAGRRAVIQALDLLGGHPTAAQVESAVADLTAGVHRATVYRTLETLASLGVVTHVHMSHGTTAYHLVGRATSRAHLHARCHRCGVMVDLPPDLLDEVRDRVAAASDFSLDPGHVALSGTCGACGPD